MQWILLGAVALGGCSGLRNALRIGGRHRPGHAVVRLACLYDQKPWLNLDKEGDRDPEGIHYTVFADRGRGRGALVDGTFHIEMYEIDRTAEGKLERKLVSDWIVPTNTVRRVKSKLLGKGYHLLLRWASKDIAGHEVELITRFDDGHGNVAVAGTKRLHVPKYTS